jgi:alanine racemase
MDPTRRRFLKAASLAAAAGLPGTVGAEPQPRPPAVGAGARPSAFDPWIDINVANLRHNVQEISKRSAGRPILAVIKNNGYGMGVVEAARLLESLGPIHGFAVVKMQEAVLLREAGLKKPILLMGPFDEADLADIAVRSITPMVYTPIGDALGRVAAKLQRPIPTAS